RDIDKEIMQMYGLEEEKEQEEKQCPRCYKKYKGEDNFCPRCGAPLDQKSAIDQMEVKKSGENMIGRKLDGMNDEQILERLEKLEKKLD
ncbi:MAG: zinc-ribbon domain-containing protein, partial [Candidatus Nanohaloarchaea archaeon]